MDTRAERTADKARFLAWVAVLIAACAFVLAAVALFRGVRQIRPSTTVNPAPDPIGEPVTHHESTALRLIGVDHMFGLIVYCGEQMGDYVETEKDGATIRTHKRAGAELIYAWKITETSRNKPRLLDIECFVKVENGPNGAALHLVDMVNKELSGEGAYPILAGRRLPIGLWRIGDSTKPKNSMYLDVRSDKIIATWADAERLEQ